MRLLRWILWAVSCFVVSGFSGCPITFKRVNSLSETKTSSLVNVVKNEERFRYFKMAGRSDESSQPLKLNPDEDFYSILEVNPSADQNALKRAYYRLVIKYHPDNKSTSAEKDLANKQMMIINTAYRCLKDPHLRKQYDSRKLKVNQRGSYWNREKAHDSIERPTSAPPPIADNIEISFMEFKEFLEEIYEKPFPESSVFVRELYTRLQTDPEFRANIIRNGDFERVYRHQQRRESSMRQDGYRDGEHYSIKKRYPFNRGDGSISGLQVYLKSLQDQYSTKHSMLVADNRDWGEVKDLSVIQARLQAVDELRTIGQEIESVMNEIRGLQA